ncbi:MAG: zinc metallopeptidase [Anaerolineae bacterium]
MFYWYIDPLYLWLIVIILLISGGVQLYLQRTYKRWGAMVSSTRQTGTQVAQTIFARTNVKPIPVQTIGGNLTDHFDPRENVVRLSQAIATQGSIAAMAVTAHELGHVQQYQQRSPMIAARNILLPALQFTPTLSYIALLMGIIFNLTGLIWLGIIFFALMVLFSILTVPIEFNASNRGMKLLEESGLINTDVDRQGARSLLRAAGLTYVAAAVTSVLQLLYLITVARRSA